MRLSCGCRAACSWKVLCERALYTLRGTHTLMQMRFLSTVHSRFAEAVFVCVCVCVILLCVGAHFIVS